MIVHAIGSYHMHVCVSCAHFRSLCIHCEIESCLLKVSIHVINCKVHACPCTVEILIVQVALKIS